MLNKKTPTIGFRLDPVSYERLELVAFKSGVSVHEAARRLLADTLSDNNLERLKERIDGLEKNVNQLSKGLANAVEALLVVSEKVTKEEAESWVDQHIRR